MTPRSTSERLEISTLTDAAVVRSAVLRFAMAQGLARHRAAELALAASELATNIVKHAGRGELLLEREAGAVLVTARDRGPGAPHPEELFTDGVSGGAPRSPDSPIERGRGTGGAALARLCDEVEIGDRPGGGAIVRCRKYLS